MTFELRVLAIVFAVTLQVQATLPIGATGIRVAVSDLFLPIALIYIAIRLLTSPMRFNWRTPGTVWWLVAITVAMTIALFVGVHHLGHWSSWALVNKFGGWFVLLAYFLVGTVIVQSGGIDLRDEFLTVFLTTAAIVAGVNVLAMPWLMDFYTLPLGIEFNRASGAMQNSNAFGFLLVVTSILVIARGHRVNLLLPPILAALWFSSSRGALLTLTVAAVSYWIFSPRRLLPAARSAAFAVLAIVVVTGAAIAVNPERLAEAQSGHSPLGLFSPERMDPESTTVVDRWDQTVRAFSLIASAPIFGNGLGYFVELTGTTLHNSLLWLIVETGLAGTLSIVGFLGSSVRSLYSDRDDAFSLGMLVVAIAFAVMSATGEYLYQRHLWLLLGMAMTRPATGSDRR